MISNYDGPLLTPNLKIHAKMSFVTVGSFDIQYILKY